MSEITIPPEALEAARCADECKASAKDYEYLRACEDIAAAIRALATK